MRHDVRWWVRYAYPFTALYLVVAVTIIVILLLNDTTVPCPLRRG